MPQRFLNLPDSACVARPGTGERLSAPSAARNGEAILKTLRVLAPDSGSALEIASGTGEHVARFAKALPGLVWQPTDLDDSRLASIAAWTEEIPNVLPPLRLDVGTAGWSQTMEPADLIFLSNLLHLISDDEAATVISESCLALRPLGVLAIYGPFRRGEFFASDGDRRFHADLTAQDPAIGYKPFETVLSWFRTGGLAQCEIIDMPANNLMLTARKPG